LNLKSGPEAIIIADDGRDWHADGGLPGGAWEHVSARIGGLQPRCPSWFEMCEIKNLFWAEEEAVIQFHPPASSYVNRHPNMLHMWRPIEQELPMPPMEAV
jgi:hypothetical protein